LKDKFGEGSEDFGRRRQEKGSLEKMDETIRINSTTKEE
jgi:hypothetical protein